MLTNEQMIPNRVKRFADARRRIRFITDQLALGRTVMLCTHLKVTQYTKKHIGMFRATKTGAYVQRGKSWDCIDYVSVKVYQ
jgi:hypothetical protein